MDRQLRNLHVFRVALLASFAMFALLSVASAVPYIGNEFTYYQPDGSTFQVQLFGDEFFAYQRTLDGREVIIDPDTDYWCYARLSSSGESFESTGIPVVTAKVGSGSANLPQAKALGATPPNQTLPSDVVLARVREAQQKYHVDEKGRPLPADMTTQSAPGAAYSPAPPPFATLGSVVGLCILVDFPDQPGTISPARVDDFCNQPTGYVEFGNACSVNEYYRIQSNGKFDYTNTVTAYVRVPKPKSYYDSPSAATTTPQELVTAALDVLIENGFDFTGFTQTGMGVIKSVNIYYAGTCTAGWSKGLWPHNGSLANPKVVDLVNNISVSGYQMSDMRNSLKIGTFCHENGHMTCLLPDLYSYVSPNPDIIGQYSLMSAGSWGGGDGSHPTNIDPYLKMKAGWADIVNVNSTSHVRATAQVDRNYFYKYNNPASPLEYFIFENRNNTGYEGPYGGAATSVAPGRGLVVWHVKQSGSNTQSTIQQGGTYTTPYEAFIVEAEPTTAFAPWYKNPLPSADAADTFYQRYGEITLDDNSTPNLNFWSNTGRTVASGLTLHSYGPRGSTLSYTIGVGDPPATPVIGLTATALAPTCDLGSNPANDSFAVYNAGGGMLTYNIADDVNWLSCTPVGGSVTTDASVITVSYDASGLAAGQYTATITVTAAGATNSPQTIPVTLTVAATPTLSVAPTSFNYYVPVGGRASDEYFTVSNTGSGTLHYTITDDAPWLTTSFTSGDCTNETNLVYIYADSIGLAPSIYVGTITIASPQATGSPQQVTVVFTVDDGIDRALLLYAAGAHGSIVGETQQVVVRGDDGTVVEAVADPGYHFKNWSDGSTQNPRTDTDVLGDTIVTANFELNPILSVAPTKIRYNVAENATANNESFSISNLGGDTMQYTITSDAGWLTPSVSSGDCTAETDQISVGVDSSGLAPSIYIGTLTISAAQTSGSPQYVTVIMAVIDGTDRFLLMYAAGAHGSIVGDTPQVVVSGDNATAVDAVPDVNYHFVNWSDGSTQDPRTDTNVAADVDVTANFAIDTYTLTFQTDATPGATLTGSTVQTINYDEDGSEVIAVAPPHWHFVRWTLGGLEYATTPAITVTNVNANMTFTAEFEVDVYTLTYTAGTNGSISGTSPQSVVYTQSGTAVTAVPDANYHFVNWSDGSTDNPRTDTNVTADADYIANFAGDTVTVTFQTDGTVGASLTGDLNQTVNYGANTTTVTAVPPATWHFLRWMLDGQQYATTPAITVTNVTGNMAFTAEFSIDAYSVSYMAGDGGSITGDTEQIVNHGSDATAVTAVADPHYLFVDWSDGSTDNPRTDTNITTHLLVTANFAIETYTVTFQTDGTAGASLTGNANQIVGHGGNAATVTAVPPANWHFVRWLLNGEEYSTTAALTVANVTENMTFTADFAIDAYTLTYTPGQHGSISGTTPQTVNRGSDGTAVTAVPDPHYHFVSWSDGSTSNPRTDTNVTADLSVTANFAIDTYTITFQTDGTTGATLTGPTSQTIDHGSDTTTVTAVPPVHWHFVRWLLGGVEYSTTAALTIEDVTSNMAFTAEFAIDRHSLTLPVLPELTAGTITPNPAPGPDGKYNYGTTVTLSATASADYSFSSWTGDVAGTASSIQVFMNTNKTVTANFTRRYTLIKNIDPPDAGSITATPAPGLDGKYLKGTVVTLTAHANTDYSFSTWQGDALGNNITAQVIMDDDRAVTAAFLRRFAISVAASPANTGSIQLSPAPGTDGKYVYGTVVTVTPKPNVGYEFTSWSGDASGTAPQLELTVAGDISITANFAQRFALSTMCSPFAGGTVQASPPPGQDGLYAIGTVVTLTANPNSTYSFGGWGGAIVDPSNPVQITMDGAKTVNATFIKRYALTTNVDPSKGAVQVDPLPDEDGLYLSGTVVTLTPVANESHSFISWSGSAAGSTVPLQVTMTTNKTISANFLARYTLNVTASPDAGGHVVAQPEPGEDGKYISGTIVTLTAVPSDNWTFNAWTGHTASAATSTQITMSGNKSVQANFTTRFSLALDVSPPNSGAVSVTPAPGPDGKYVSGTVVRLVPNASQYYTFDSWSGSLTGSQAPVDIVMDANKTIVAGYTHIPTTALISGIHWSSQTDADGDSYRSGMTLNCNVDVTGGTGPLSVYAVVYQSAAGANVWSPIGSIDDYTITGTSSADAWTLLVDAKPHGLYDYRVEVYQTGEFVPDDIAGPNDFPALAAHAEELAAEDTTPDSPAPMSCPGQLTPSVKELVLPLDLAGAPGAETPSTAALSIRLSANSDIAPETVWVEADIDGVPCAGAVQWSLAGEDAADGWVTFTPDQPLAGVLTLAAGATTVDGLELVPVIYTYHMVEAAQLKQETELVEIDGLRGSEGPAYGIAHEGVFAEPLTIELPVPEGLQPEDVDIYYYSQNINHQGWFLGENVEGWLLPESRQTVVCDGQLYIQFQVRHSGIVQLRSAGQFSLATLRPSLPDLLVIASVIAFLMLLGKRKRAQI